MCRAFIWRVLIWTPRSLGLLCNQLSHRGRCCIEQSAIPLVASARHFAHTRLADVRTTAVLEERGLMWGAAREVLAQHRASIAREWLLHYTEAFAAQRLPGDRELPAGWETVAESVLGARAVTLIRAVAADTRMVSQVGLLLAAGALRQTLWRCCGISIYGL